MVDLEYTLSSTRSFHDIVEAVLKRAAEKGMRVLHVHDVQATLAEKGFEREPLKIIELCNARYANEVLQKDSRISLMMPCKIVIRADGNRNWVSVLRPTALAHFYPDAGIDEIAIEVDRILRDIVNDALSGDGST